MITNAKIKKMTKDDLYKRTGWFSQNCQMLVDNLAKFGLAIVDTNDINKIAASFTREDDDLK